MWKRIWVLFLSRNKEFYRDRSSLGWSLLFPFFVIFGFGLVFNDDNQVLYKVGVFHQNTIQTNKLNFQFDNFKKTRFIEFIEFKTKEDAFNKLLHHRIDLFIAPEIGEYWVSKSSPKGYITEKLLLSSEVIADLKFQKQLLSKKEIPYIEWLFPGVLGMNMMFSALFGVGYVVVRYRKNGALKRLSTTPVTPFEFLTAQIVSRMFILLVTTVIVYVGCALIYNFECRGSYLSLIFVFILGGFSMISLGLLISARSSSEEFAGGLLNILTWPMMFLSEVWFSLEGAKPWVQQISNLFPLTHMIDAARKIMNDGYSIFDVRFQVLVMLGMSVLFLLSGSLLFKWQKN